LQALYECALRRVQEQGLDAALPERKPPIISRFMYTRRCLARRSETDAKGPVLCKRCDSTERMRTYLVRCGSS